MSPTSPFGLSGRVTEKAGRLLASSIDDQFFLAIGSRTVNSRAAHGRTEATQVKSIPLDQKHQIHYSA
eukprot:3693443-Amphidinium_carterae.1